MTSKVKAIEAEAVCSSPAVKAILESPHEKGKQQRARPPSSSKTSREVQAYLAEAPPSAQEWETQQNRDTAGVHLSPWHNGSPKTSMYTDLENYPFLELLSLTVNYRVIKSTGHNLSFVIPRIQKCSVGCLIKISR